MDYRFFPVDSVFYGIFFSFPTEFLAVFRVSHRWVYRKNSMGQMKYGLSTQHRNNHEIINYHKTKAINSNYVYNIVHFTTKRKKKILQKFFGTTRFCLHHNLLIKDE
jgi:hypothetical protein